MESNASERAVGLATSVARTRHVLISVGAGVLLAIVTLGYLMTVGSKGDVSTLAAYAPFLLPAAIAGVAPPSYVALDMIGRRRWLTAAVASAVALLVAFVVFWSAAIVAAPRPLQVRMDPATVVLSKHYDRADWQRYPDLRDRMADDLIASGLLEGMTAEQVRLELGKPSRVVGPELTSCVTSWVSGSARRR